MNCARFDSARPDGRGWHLRLERPRTTHVAIRPDEVEAVLARAEEAARDGCWAAVAVSYEAAVAFEPALRVAPRRADDVPLVWVKVYERGVEHLERCVAPAAVPRKTEAGRSIGSFVPALDCKAFSARVRAAQEHIRAGDSYQLNLTFPMRADEVPDPDAWYDELRAAQQAGYCARLDLPDHLVLSLSPELFFERRGDLVTARPMKGTAPRGRWLKEDEATAQALVASGKERAENVMIVDLLRNDIGRVARPGTVRVPELFHIERYPTLWQMTSTVEGCVDATVPLVDLFRALFPCGSVTGAPKIRSMEIIAALERQPRGLYTGAIGFVRPGGDCTFSIPIRTIVIDRRTGAATMGVGAGITADSVPQHEYAECLLKAAFLNRRKEEGERRKGELLETIRLENGVVARLERHLARMAASARYFGYAWDEDRVRAAVDAARAGHAAGCWRLRLLVDPAGAPLLTCEPHDADTRGPWRVALADRPIDDRDPFLFNKTTHRGVYDAARRSRADVDDVLLWNGRGEITESTIANLVAEIDGVRVTPPVECGLLAGTYRAELLEAGVLQERVLAKADLTRATGLWLINSLRGWIEARLVP